MSDRWRLIGSAIVLGAGFSLAQVASGQLLEGATTLVAPFTIEFGGQVVGRVVVVSCDNSSPPSGYSAGTEYWTWTAGTPWRGAFELVPASSVPAYSANTWETFPHEHFDLSDTVPLPSIDPDPNDRFYAVSIADGSGGWVDQGWMWLEVGSPSVQSWYGLGLTDDLVGDGGEIRFESVEPPSAGSEDVYLLQ